MLNIGRPACYPLATPSSAKIRIYFEDSVLNLDEASWLEAVDRIKVGTNLLSG